MRKGGLRLLSRDLTEDVDPDAAYAPIRVFDVKSYGATGDGTTNDRADVQEAIDAANAVGGGIVHFPKGTYRVDTSLTLYSNITVCFAAGAVIDFSNAADGDILFEAAGTIAAGSVLTANSAAGDTTIDVTSGAGFAAGDLVQIIDEVSWRSGSQGKAGEAHTVASVAGNVVTLREGLWGSYTTAQTATLRKITPLDNITIEGMGELVGKADPGEQIALDLTAARRVTVRDVKVRRFNAVGLRFNTCFDIDVQNCRFEDIYFAATTTSYGVVFYNGCQWATVAGCSFSRMRHAVAGGTVTTEYGINRFVTIDRNNVYGMVAAGLDGHAACQYWTFSNNHITALTATSAGDGIVFEGADVTIIGNTIVGAQRDGIFWDHQYAPVDAVGVIVGNTVIRPTGRGVQVIGSKTIGLVLQGNTIVTPASNGIEVKSTTGYLRKPVIVGNTVITPTLRGIYLLANGGEVSDFAITGNMSSATTDSIMVRTVTGTVSGGTISGNSATTSGASTAGIRVQRDADTMENVIVTGNYAKGAYGILGSGTLTNCVAPNNRAVGSTADVSGIGLTGWGAPTGTATRTTFATGSVTTAQLAERVKAIIDDLGTIKTLVP